MHPEQHCLLGLISSPAGRLAIHAAHAADRHGDALPKRRRGSANACPPKQGIPAVRKTGPDFRPLERCSSSPVLPQIERESCEMA
jgi:hypothetical protein